MSDWQIGDLAVCVDDSPCRCGCGAVRWTLGRAYTVVGLIGPNPPHWCFLALDLDGVIETALHCGPVARGVHEKRFRKIRPDEREACEPEFVTLLKRLRSPAKVE